MAISPTNNSSVALPVLLLRNLGNAEKTTHWIHQDCTTSSSCLFERIWFCLAAKYFQTTRSWMNIDLEQSRAILEKIRDRNQNLNDVHLIYIFNNAVGKFNTIAPRHLVEPVLPEPLVRFAETCIAAPVVQFPKDLLSSPTRCSQEAIQSFTSEKVIKACLRQRLRPELTDLEYTSDIIHRFEEQGGFVVILPTMQNRPKNEPCLGVLASDEISGVCHAGLVRSQTISLACKLVNLKLNVPLEKQNIRLPHGIRAGYDCQDISKPMSIDHSMATQFGEAFGIVRAPRFGQEYGRTLAQASSWWADSNSSCMEDYFNKNYYTHQKENGRRKIFLTFAETGLSVMERLISVNAKKGDLPLKGVFVVIIPDEDWISYYQMNPDLHRLLYELCLSKLMPRSDKNGLIESTQSNLKESSKLLGDKEMRRSPTILGMQSLKDMIMEIDSNVNQAEEGEWLLNNSINNLTPQSRKEIQRFAEEVVREIHHIPPLSDNISNVAQRHIYRLALRRYASLFQPLYQA